MNPTYLLVRNFAIVLATIGLYSVLYRENKLFRFFEHMFLGLAVGWAVVAMWTETLYSTWWIKMIGSANTAAVNGQPAHHGQPGYWVWATLLPISFCGYLVFSKKYNWMSRIPIGIILGLWSGQQVQVWFTQYGPQFVDSMRPIVPNTHVFARPDINGLSGDALANIKDTVYGSQAIDNIIYLVTLLSVMSYFLYSFDVKHKFLARSQTMGRWLLMIGFGAIFGSTVMMRFSLLIDRMSFIFIEFLKQGVFHIK
ncbi:MAG: hypothetical protein ACYC96_10265 [Fimbriimonadaceae bacterium]